MMAPPLREFPPLGNPDAPCEEVDDDEDDAEDDDVECQLCAELDAADGPSAPTDDAAEVLDDVRPAW